MARPTNTRRIRTAIAVVPSSPPGPTENTLALHAYSSLHSLDGNRIMSVSDFRRKESVAEFRVTLFDPFARDTGTRIDGCAIGIRVTRSPGPNASVFCGIQATKKNV